MRSPVGSSRRAVGVEADESLNVDSRRTCPGQRHRPFGWRASLPHEVVHGEFVATELGVRLVEERTTRRGTDRLVRSCAFFTLRS